MVVKPIVPGKPQRYRQQAHSPASKLPEGDLVFFLLDVVPKLDLSQFYAPYEQETRGGPPFDPAMMVCLLLYAYCVGVFSSRKIALACERNLAFLAIVGEDRPDFRTISDFRKLHLEAFKAVFVQVVRLAGAAGLVKLGNVSTDGTKIQGNASRHKAMSYGYMKKEVERIREDIEALVTRAYQQDEAEEAALGSRRGDELPRSWPGARRAWPKLRPRCGVWKRKPRLKQTPSASAAVRQTPSASGTARNVGAKRPKRSMRHQADKAQMSFTDPELHIMQTNNKGWDYCGNAQASVDGAYQIIVACDVTDATNDKQQAAPMAQAILETLEQAEMAPHRNDAGEVQAIPATLDSGYYSEAATQALEALGFEPYIATARQRHHAPAPEPLEASATAQERMAAKVRSPAGQALYSRRKVIVEPVFGQIKEARGFRRFLLRGLDKVRGEWRLVCLGHNLLKLWRYGRALRTV